MTKLIQLTFFLLFCLQIPLKAQIPTEKAILWEVSGKDLPKSSYLFGTFHLLCPDDLQVSSTIKEKFDSSKQLYLEIDFSDPNIGMKMMQMMQMRNDSTFHDLYDSLTYAQINDTLEKHTHMGLDMFNKIKPFGLYSVVMMSALGCQPASWELTLVKMAKEKGWKMNGLETLESQAAIFDTVPYLLQAEQLKEMAFNMDSTKQEMNKLIKLYKEQDINTMHEKITSDPLTENYLDIMLYNRNANWISTIIKQAQTTSTFFAFGAGHLGGEKGVINLLRRRGYTVRPINPLDDKSN